MVQVCANSVSFLFQVCPKLVPVAPNVSIFAQKSASRPATSSLLCLQVSRRNCFAFNFAVSFLLASFTKLLRFQVCCSSLLPIRTASSKFAPYLQVSRQNCFASKFVSNQNCCFQLCSACKFRAETALSRLCFQVCSASLGFSNLSKNCAACKLPFCLNGSCDVASGVSWIAGGGAEVGGRR